MLFLALVVHARDYDEPHGTKVPYGTLGPVIRSSPFQSGHPPSLSIILSWSLMIAKWVGQCDVRLGFWLSITLTWSWGMSQRLITCLLQREILHLNQGSLWHIWILDQCPHLHQLILVWKGQGFPQCHTSPGLTPSEVSHLQGIDRRQTQRGILVELAPGPESWESGPAYVVQGGLRHSEKEMEKGSGCSTARTLWGDGTLAHWTINYSSTTISLTLIAESSASRHCRQASKSCCANVTDGQPQSHMWNCRCCFRAMLTQCRIGCFQSEYFSMGSSHELVSPY